MELQNNQAFVTLTNARYEAEKNTRNARENLKSCESALDSARARLALYETVEEQYRSAMRVLGWEED